MTSKRLARDQILSAFTSWNLAWAHFDLDAVMALFHEDIVFDNWTGGRATGLAGLRAAWDDWFRGRKFRFIDQDVFIDEQAQKLLYQWELDWVPPDNSTNGSPERRRGVDVLHFSDGKIIRKLTYCKTTVEIAGKRHKLQL